MKDGSAINSAYDVPWDDEQLMASKVDSDDPKKLSLSKNYKSQIQPDDKADYEFVADIGIDIKQSENSDSYVMREESKKGK